MLYPAMRKHLQLALMATSVIATFLSLPTPYVQAEAGSDRANSVITTSTDDSGRKIYVNESIPVMTAKRTQSPVRQNSLAYWSTAEHRWKPVPSANIRAARSAAEEVNHYLGEDLSSGAPAQNFVRGKG